MTKTTKTENNKSNLIEKILYLGSQSINYIEMYYLGDSIVKLKLKSDSYKFQCEAGAYVLDGLDWKLIYTIPGVLMKTENGLHSTSAYKNNPNAAEKEFREDILTLKKFVKILLRK